MGLNTTTGKPIADGIGKQIANSGTHIWRSGMLILTRRVGESLMIGDEVNVTVLGIKGNQVRIGVNAPKEVAVHREEIYQRIQEENESSDGKVANGND